MTEGVVIKTKRNGARIFKNPPQPHMCIQDFMQGSELPCYVNVLSWDKVATHCNLYQNVPLYGGMRVSPPRGEKAEVGVFAVIAHPDVLKQYGKNCKDLKEQATLIDSLLDFVETKNEGVYFSRQYVILKDKDITGELKEVWMAVQAKRERENLLPQQETWIDAQPPTPQYPQYSDQQTQHQQLQTPPQQQQQQPLQQHQQQQQQQPQHVEYAHPPQYQSNAAYSIGPLPSNEIVNHEREILYNYQQQNPIVTQSEQIYQSFNLQDRCYNYRERGQPNMQQNAPQQNCPAYPAPQYQFQQLPRQMVPQYVNSNMHINSNPNSNMANQKYKMNVSFASKIYEKDRQMDQQMQQQKQQQQQQQVSDKSQSNNTMYVPVDYKEMWLADQVLQQQQQQQHQQQQQQQQMRHQVPRRRIKPRSHQHNPQMQRQMQQLQYCPVTENLRVEQIHQIQKQMNQQIQEQQQFINYQQSTNQQYQIQTQQMPQSQNQPQSQSKRKNSQYNGDFNKTQNRTIKLGSDMRKWSNKQDLTDCEISDPSKRTTKKRCFVQWNSVPRKPKVLGDKLNQTKADGTMETNDQDEGYHQAYTILKKPEASTMESSATINIGDVSKSTSLEDEIDKKIAQLSIEDCKETTEVNAVLS